MKESKKTIPVKLSLKYMMILCGTIIFICIVFILSLYFYIKSNRFNELQKSLNIIENTIQKGGISELDFVELPYFVYFNIYSENQKKIVAQNNQFIPFININDEKLHETFEKDFYSDGNLHISHLNRRIKCQNDFYTIQCVLDIENDSLLKMIKKVPFFILFSVIPVMCLSFFLSFLISRKTITAFELLQFEYEQEKAFSSNVSHELKTPISIIDGHANLIKRWGKNDSKQLEESINVILAETQNMKNIVQTLLDISKIEKGILKPEKNKVFISNIFSKVRNEFSSIYPNVKFFINDENFIEIESDEKMLHQIFTIIVSNSIKFAGDNCQIQMNAIQKDSKIELSIIDNGSGFEKNDLEHVFDRFYKSDKSHSRNGSGAGLGLSIAKVLSQVLSFKISAQNSKSGGAEIKLSQINI